jgi:uncharacterized LabA/DUF88 family protein
MSESRVLLAVDSNNLFISARQNDEFLDYEALLAYVSRLGLLVRSCIYVGRPSDGQDRAFLLRLKSLGFSQIVARSLRRCPDGRNKSDIDTALVMDVWQAVLSNQADLVVLATGDSDFVPLVERIASRDLPVWVIGPNGSTAWELKVAATRFVDIRDVPGALASAAGSQSLPRLQGHEIAQTAPSAPSAAYPSP